MFTYCSVTTWSWYRDRKKKILQLQIHLKSWLQKKIIFWKYIKGDFDVVWYIWSRYSVDICRRSETAFSYYHYLIIIIIQLFFNFWPLRIIIIQLLFNDNSIIILLLLTPRKPQHPFILGDIQASAPLRNSNSILSHRHGAEAMTMRCLVLPQRA